MGKTISWRDTAATTDLRRKGAKAQRIRKEQQQQGKATAKEKQQRGTTRELLKSVFFCVHPCTAVVAVVAVVSVVSAY